MIIVYADGHFKSVVNEFNPTLSDKQLQFILHNITEEAAYLLPTFEAKAPGKITIIQTTEATELHDPINEKAAVNIKVAIWCRLYEKHIKETTGNSLKYKTNAAERGKLDRLTINEIDFEKLVTVYFNSNEWYLKPKSVSNFVVKLNEVRALTFAPAPKKTYPLPYSEVYDVKLPQSERVKYWQFLRDNGYTHVSDGRVNTWVKRQTN